MAIIRLEDGRLILAGGSFLTTAQEGNGGAGTPLTSLQIQDYYTHRSDAEPVFQRKAGFDYADVPVVFNFEGESAAFVHARVIEKDSGNVIVNWKALANVSQTGTGASKTGLGMITSVPLGAGYVIQVRDSLQTTTQSNGTQKWGVGIVWVTMGQSNMIGTLNGGSAGNGVPGSGMNELEYWNSKTYPTVFFGLRGFVEAWYSVEWNETPIGGVALAFLRILAKSLQTKYGKKVPVCLIPWAINGTGIGTFYKENASLYNANGTTSPNIGLSSPKNFHPGDFEGISFHQGEADVGMSRSQRLEALKKVYTDAMQVTGRTPQQLSFLVAILGIYNGHFLGIEKIRGAAVDLDAFAKNNGWPKVRTSWSCIDLDPSIESDGQHFSGIRAKMSGFRMIHDVLHELVPEQVPTTAQGPRLSGTATRSGNTITLPIVKTAGTTLLTKNGNAVSGFSVNTSEEFTGTDVTCVAALSGDNAILTLTNAPAGTLYVKHCGGNPGTAASNYPDISNLIYDNMPYPTGCTGTDLFTGLPLQPTPTAIQVN